MNVTKSSAEAVRSVLGKAARSAVAFFGLAVAFATYWDMHVRHLVFDLTGWFVSVVTGVAGLIVALALPLPVTAFILSLYVAVIIFHMIDLGPIYYFVYLRKVNGTASDIFFGTLIFLIEVVILLGFAVWGLAGRIRTRRRSGRAPAPRSNR